jgi:hypothetical protein
MEIFQCRPQDIDAAWRDGADKLGEATKWAAREITVEQLKLLLARGERILIGARDDGRVVGWAAVGVMQFPNIRVLHIYAIQGKGLFTPGWLRLLREYAAHHGCTSIRGCVRPSMERFVRRFGGQQVYATVELQA